MAKGKKAKTTVAAHVQGKAEQTAEEKAASDAQREQMAKDANKKRNEALLEARNRIADNADEIKSEEDDLEPLTDDKWDQEDRPDQVTRQTRAQRLAAQDAAQEGEEEDLTEDEAAARLLRRHEEEDIEADEARDAGADDSRKNDDGETEYRIERSGKVEWLTLAELRSSAGDEEESETSRQRGGEGVRTAPTRTPSPEALEAQRQAEEQARTAKAERKAKLKDLLSRASMGDDEAIDALADMQADDSRVTPELLNRMVDERVDARVEGKTAFDRAVEWFESEDGYARELAAPGFKAKAAAIDVRLAKEHPDLSPRKRFEMLGQELRKDLRELQKYLGVTPSAGNGRRAEPESKLDRKRNAPAEVPRASGRQRPDVEPDEKQTTSDAIAQLAKGRGQHRPIAH